MRVCKKKQPIDIYYYKRDWTISAIILVPENVMKLFRGKG